jgi:hypothetical protein
LRWALKEQCKKSVRPVDFSQAYWTPPLPPKLAFEVESNQIEIDLELMSLVSLTDHDSIGAPSALRELPDPIRIPFAVEWSVPFEGAVFHLGVHNLPESHAHLIMDDLADYTKNPSVPRLLELLAALNELPEVLIVFNHPLWDQHCLGQSKFRSILDRFLQSTVGFLHAFELNAMRAWNENKGVIQAPFDFRRRPAWMRAERRAQPDPLHEFFGIRRGNQARAAQSHRLHAAVCGGAGHTFHANCDRHNPRLSGTSRGFPPLG